MNIIEKIIDSQLTGTGFALTSREAAQVARVFQIAERICAKLEHPSASVTMLDQEDLRAALNDARAGQIDVPKTLPRDGRLRSIADER
jgi:hypothetical protein